MEHYFNKNSGWLHFTYLVEFKNLNILSPGDTCVDATVKELPKALPRCLISIAKLKAQNSFQHVTNKIICNYAQKIMFREKWPHLYSIRLLTWQAVTTKGKIWRISIKHLQAANYRSIHYFSLLHFPNYLNFLQWVLLLSQWKIILLLKKS